jgi:hypothetical protein
MRARSLEAGRFEGARFGVRCGVVGIGEPLPIVPATLSEALLLTSEEHGTKAGRMLLRLSELADSSLLWTQTGPEEFRLGQITGPWRFECSAPARLTGIHNVRPTDWLAHQFELPEVPAAVAESFNRGGRNLQMVRSAEGSAETSRLWTRYTSS